MVEKKKSNVGLVVGVVVYFVLIGLLLLLVFFRWIPWSSFFWVLVPFLVVGVIFVVFFISRRSVRLKFDLKGGKRIPHMSLGESEKLLLSEMLSWGIDFRWSNSNSVRGASFYAGSGESKFPIRVDYGVNNYDKNPLLVIRRLDKADLVLFQMNPDIEKKSENNGKLVLDWEKVKSLADDMAESPKHLRVVTKRFFDPETGEVTGESTITSPVVDKPIKSEKEEENL